LKKKKKGIKNFQSKQQIRIYYWKKTQIKQTVNYILFKTKRINTRQNEIKTKKKTKNKKEKRKNHNRKQNKLFFFVKTRQYVYKNMNK
jgi:hypothetical protein